MPVMKRELASKMYTPTTYFLGRFASNLLISLFYPVIMILFIFWGIGIEASTDNFLLLMSFGILSNMVFCGQGYFMGIWIADEISVKTMNMFFVMFWLTTNGVVCNLRTANWFIKGLAHISPLRFACEGITRALIKQIPDLDSASDGKIKISSQDVLETLGYTWGVNYCICGLAVWILVWTVLSLVVINLKYGGSR